MTTKFIEKTIRYTSFIKTQFIEANEFCYLVKREIEQFFSYHAEYSVNDISFIYRITPEICVDFLNLNQEQYYDMFKDIVIRRYGYQETTLSFLNGVIDNVFHTYCEVSEEGKFLDQSAYSLEEG